MTNLRDYVHTMSGRTVWHGDNDLELQCAQWGFGEAGTARIVAPDDKVLIYKQVEAAASGRWVSDPETVKLGPGKSTRSTGPPWPNNLRLYEAELHDYKGGEAEGTEHTILTDIGDKFQGLAEDYDWVVWMVAAIIILIIVVGLYVTARKAGS